MPPLGFLLKNPYLHSGVFHPAYINIYGVKNSFFGVVQSEIIRSGVRKQLNCVVLSCYITTMQIGILRVKAIGSPNWKKIDFVMYNDTHTIINFPKICNNIRSIV